MKVRFLGDGDHAVCSVFGQSFPVGEWVSTEHPKLAANPLFEVEAGDTPPAAPTELEVLRAQLDELGVTYAKTAGVARLTKLLDQATAPSPEA